MIWSSGKACRRRTDIGSIPFGSPVSSKVAVYGQFCDFVSDI